MFENTGGGYAAVFFVLVETAGKGEREGLAPLAWPRPAGRRAGLRVMPLGMVAVFSCRGGCNTMAGPGFFVPALQWPFILRVSAAQKRAA